MSARPADRHPGCSAVARASPGIGYALYAIQDVGHALVQVESSARRLGDEGAARRASSTPSRSAGCVYNDIVDRLSSTGGSSANQALEAAPRALSPGVRSNRTAWLLVFLALRNRPLRPRRLSMLNRTAALVARAQHRARRRLSVHEAHRPGGPGRGLAWSSPKAKSSAGSSWPAVTAALDLPGAGLLVTRKHRLGWSATTSPGKPDPGCRGRCSGPTPPPCASRLGDKAPLGVAIFYSGRARRLGRRDLVGAPRLARLARAGPRRGPPRQPGLARATSRTSLGELALSARCPRRRAARACWCSSRCWSSAISGAIRRSPMLSTEQAPGDRAIARGARPRGRRERRRRSLSRAH